VIGEGERRQEKGRGDLRTPRQICPVVAFVFAAMILVAGCALRSRNPGEPPSRNEVKSGISQHCPDRLQRARTGGFVGGVFGAIAASIIGSPILGGLYQVTGYAVGFGSGETCRKADGPTPTTVSSKDHPSAPSVIIEEDL